MTKAIDTFCPTKDEKIKLTNDGALEVIFLGTGSAFATTRFQSNIFVVKGKTHLMIDLGSKASIALDNAGLSVFHIDNLLVTHSHADHIGGIEELCLKTRYVSTGNRPTGPGGFRPRLLTTSDYAKILWDNSLSGGLEHSEECAPDKRLVLTDFMDINLGQDTSGYDRPAYNFSLGQGADTIDFTIMRTHHIPGNTCSWQNAFYSVGMLIDNRVFISGDTMFDEKLVETFGRDAEVIFHDCQDFKGGVHASYAELSTLPAAIRQKMFLYHLPDGIEKKYDPRQDGFAGWTQAYDKGSYIFR